MHTMKNENIGLEHHKQFEYCGTRLQYRAGKQFTAVKVYTIANESKHLLIFGVPRINLIAEVKRELQKYGPIKSIEMITDKLATETNVTIEQFTDCYHCVFEKLQHARRAKKFIDRKNFYGGILHVSYATEYETVDEIRQKMNQRRSEVKYRIRIAKKNRINMLNIHDQDDDDDDDVCDNTITDDNSKFKAKPTFKHAKRKKYELLK